MSASDDFPYQVFQNLQDMIKFADSKASISFTIVGIVISIILGSSIYGDVFDKLLKINSQELTIAYLSSIILFLSLASLAIIFALLVCFARNGEADQHKGLIHFSHISEYQSYSDYANKINELGSNEIKQEYAKQNFVLSKIAFKKMKYVNRSIIFLVLTILSTIILFSLFGYISLVYNSTVGG